MTEPPVFTHRDPVKSITSYASLTSIVRRVGSDAVDPIEVADYIDHFDRPARRKRGRRHVSDPTDADRPGAEATTMRAWRVHEYCLPVRSYRYDRPAVRASTRVRPETSAEVPRCSVKEQRSPAADRPGSRSDRLRW